jgi:hypothetical protein
MAKGSRRRRTAPKRGLLGPLVMLAGGMAVGAVVWRFLMLEPRRPVDARWTPSEQLSRQDRHALDRLLGEQRSRP